MDKTQKAQSLRGKSGLFGEVYAEIGEIEPQWEDVKLNTGRISRKLQRIAFGGKEYLATDRFINSVCSRFGIGPSIFNLFDPNEVFERLHEVEQHTAIRFITEGNMALAATNPTKAFVDYDSVLSVLTRPSRLPSVVDLGYKDGVFWSIMQMDQTWDINGDVFDQTFTVETPIDGYGPPSIYLSLHRQASDVNFMVLSKAFKSEIQLGKDIKLAEIPLMRALDAFNNEEGFQAIRQRLQAAQMSWASLHETATLEKALYRAMNTANAKRFVPIFEAYSDMTGDFSKKYGIASVSALSTKKARLLQMNCTVADLVNFATEVCRYCRQSLTNPRTIYLWLGQLIENEYDLEMSVDEDQVQTPRDYWLKSRPDIQAMFK
jgi:hypothetical protein